MTELSPIKITPSDQFDHLPRAPIVEAVIQLRARAEVPQSLEDLKAVFNEELPEYTTVKSLGSVSVTLSLEPEKASASGAQPGTPEQRWHGLRLESEDGRYVAMFTREHFSLSRLKPYEDWESFSREAIRLWGIHAKLADPSEIQRVGVRFINRFDVTDVLLDPSDYLKGLVTPPSQFPSSGFFYRDNLSVPGHPYRVTLVRTVQPLPSPPSMGLLLDIDVFVHQPFPPDLARIEERLADMHWLKNYFFFANVTETALDLCR